MCDVPVAHAETTASSHWCLLPHTLRAVVRLRKKVGGRLLSFWIVTIFSVSPDVNDAGGAATTQTYRCVFEQVKLDEAIRKGTSFIMSNFSFWGVGGGVVGLPADWIC